MKNSIFTCDRCGTAQQGEEIEPFGMEMVPAGWTHILAEDFTRNNQHAVHLHYCAECAKRIITLLKERKP